MIIDTVLDCIMNWMGVCQKRSRIRERTPPNSITTPILPNYSIPTFSITLSLSRDLQLGNMGVVIEIRRGRLSCS